MHRARQLAALTAAALAGALFAGPSAQSSDPCHYSHGNLWCVAGTRLDRADLQNTHVGKLVLENSTAATVDMESARVFDAVDASNARIQMLKLNGTLVRRTVGTPRELKPYGKG